MSPSSTFMPPAPEQPPDLRKEATTSAAYRGWIVLFLVSFALYAATATRGIQWQDSGDQILRVVTRQLWNPLGLALCHPLHHWLGRLAAWPNLFAPTLAVTLVSSLAAAVAVANTYGCVWSLTRQRSAALFAAASLGLAGLFWQLATRTESYTLCTALLAGECWCLVVYAKTRQVRYLWTAIFLNGLGIANHLLGGLTTPVLVVVVLYELWRKRITAKMAMVAVLLWLTGTLPYSSMVAMQWVQSGDFMGTVHSAMFGNAFADNVLNVAVTKRMLLLSAVFLVYSFPNLLLPAAAYGLVRGGRYTDVLLARRALLAGWAIHAVFVLRYNVIDQHTFFIPQYVFLSIFGGLGFATIPDWRYGTARRIVTIMAVAFLAATPVVYAVVPAIARHFDVLRSVARNKPYRDDYTYLLTPWSIVEDSADRMGRHAMTLVDDRGGLVVVEDEMALFAVRYHALGLPHVEVELGSSVSPEQIEQVAERGETVVLVPHDADRPAVELRIGSWQRYEDLYVLEVKPAGVTDMPKP